MKKIRNLYGFTLMEVVIVMIILGIISVSAISLFSGRNSFSVYTTRERAISVIRQIQVNRMQSTVSADNDSFSLVINSDCLGSVTACSLNLSNSFQKAQADTRSDYVRESDISFSSANNVIDFDLLGNPLVSAGVNITINSNTSSSSTQVCINSQGYVREGACL